MKWVGVAILGIASLAFGGDVAGNGGDVVICATNAGFSYEMLDYYEAVHGPEPLQLDLGSDGWDALTKVLYVLERIQTLDPQRRQKYEDGARAFLANVDWITDGPALDDIADMGDTVIPSNCRVAQVAIRRKQFHPSIKPYLVDKRLWDFMSMSQRAGLILHELIYAETFALGQKNSILARKYNGLLSSLTFVGMAQAIYDEGVAPLFKYVPPLEFKSEQFDINAVVGKRLMLSLRTLLQYDVEGPLKWHFLSPLPEWLKLSEEFESLSGTPPGKGDLELDLVAHDGTTGAISKLRIHVKP